MEPISVQWCPVTGQEKGAQTGTKEVPCKHQEALLYCAVDGALAQGAQRCCGISLLGDLLSHFNLSIFLHLFS